VVGSLARFVQEHERANTPVTFVFSSRERERNNAVVLKAYLEKGAAAAGDIATWAVPLEEDAHAVGTPLRRGEAGATPPRGGEVSDEGVEEPEE
jgi:hypothetical protein